MENGISGERNKAVEGATVIPPTGAVRKDRVLRYLHFLEQREHLEVSLHFSGEMSPFFQHFPFLLDYNTHQNPYCFYVKNRRGEFPLCLLDQEEIRKRLAQEESFVFVCHAGVKQYVMRVLFRGKALGFVTVSGYRAETFPGDSVYRENVKKELDSAEADTLLAPLALLLSQLLEQEEFPESRPFSRILAYVQENHGDLSLPQMAKDLGYSPSHISHLFRKNTGMTLKSYTNRLKIKEACFLLESTAMPVTEVALSVGFNSFSYFIALFKAETGKTPLHYRQAREK